jgi:hypothetical protein
MFCSGKFVAAIVFGIAMSLCLTVCSMPEMFVQKASAGHCHTEQEDEKENDSQKHCCSAESMLPPQIYVSADLTQEIALPEEIVFNVARVIAKNSLARDLFVQTSSPPPAVTILRI